MEIFGLSLECVITNDMSFEFAGRCCRQAPSFKSTVFNRPNISYYVRFKDALNFHSRRKGTHEGGGPINDLITVIKEQHEKTMNSYTPYTMYSRCLE